MQISVSNLTVRDIPAILDISIECGLCLWSADAYRAEIIRDDAIMLKLTDPDKLVLGFAVGRIFEIGHDKFTVELTNIGLRQTIRNQGFGQLLLKAFLTRCRQVGGSSVILEVRESNANAIAFYRKFGFETTGRRRGFYSAPFEDALTMRLELEKPETAKIHT
jgi:ribosomal-protein-alanine N-acetyltransferase